MGRIHHAAAQKADEDNRDKHRIASGEIISRGVTCQKYRAIALVILTTTFASKEDVQIQRAMTGIPVDDFRRV